MLIKPQRLNFGDVVGIVSPASPPPDPKNLDRAIDALEQLGFKPRLAPSTRKRHGFLAGSDRERAADLMKLFSDKKVRGILCMRGGYGAARLLPLLDYRVIRAHPKVLCGYSDITALHMAFLRKAGLQSFHGPMLNSDFIKPELPEFTRSGFLRTVMQATAPGSICQSYDGQTIRILRKGRASGRLIGGNLSILCSLLATEWQPSFRNAILFFEDIDEAPYRFDRMLTQLLQTGLLASVAGIAIGINRDCVDPKATRAKEYRQSLEDVLSERLSVLRVPIVSGLPFGHQPFNATLPVGAKVTLDGFKGDLLITEPAVE